MTNLLGPVEATVSKDSPGISVSAEGRWLLYPYMANISSEVMMLDYFR